MSVSGILVYRLLFDHRSAALLLYCPPRSCFRCPAKPLRGLQFAADRHVLSSPAALAKDLGLAEDQTEVLLAPYRKECERVLEGASLLAEVSARTKARAPPPGNSFELHQPGCVL